MRVGGSVHTLMFEGPQQHSLLRKAAHPPIGMPLHSHKAFTESFCLAHVL